MLLFINIRIVRYRNKAYEQVHFFSTFFYTKIYENGINEKVLKWDTITKNCNIFEKKLLFVPIHQYLHWLLCVVVNPDKLTHPASKGNNDKCFILTLDSLGCHDTDEIYNNVRRYLIKKKGITTNYNSLPQGFIPLLQLEGTFYINTEFFIY